MLEVIETSNQQVKVIGLTHTKLCTNICRISRNPMDKVLHAGDQEMEPEIGGLKFKFISSTCHYTQNVKKGTLQNKIT